MHVKGDVVGGGLWSRTLSRVAGNMVTKSGDLDIKMATEDFRHVSSEGLEIRKKDKVNALKWLEDCKIISMVQHCSELDKVTSIGNKVIFYFRDMGLLAQLCKGLPTILPSDVNGMIAENYVYLQLRDMSGKFFMEPDVWMFSGSWGQIDFVMHTEEWQRFGIEVKHSSGGTKSGDKALADGKIDYLIRVQDTYGTIGEKQATVPIFMLDKLKYVVK